MQKQMQKQKQKQMQIQMQIQMQMQKKMGNGFYGKKMQSANGSFQGNAFQI
jgi:hypothetical protein